MSGELREQILAKTAENIPITLIAEQLGVSRQTVYKHLAAVDNWEDYLKTKYKGINRLALDAVERGIKRGDARLGLAWLEHTLLAPTVGDSYHIHGDVSLVNAVGMVPGSNTPLPTTSTPSTAVSTGQPALAERTGTEAAAKPTPVSLGLSCQTNFSQFSDEQLEAELERRRAARAEVIDAEVVR